MSDLKAHWQSWILLALAIAGGLYFSGAIPAWGETLHWQQRDGDLPIKAWHVRRVATPLPIATIERTAAVEETVTPPITPWFPTVPAGTPTPIVRQYSADIPTTPGQILVMQAEDNSGQFSTDSNTRQIPSYTPTPLATATFTQVPTATKRKPEPPHVMP